MIKLKHNFKLINKNHIKNYCMNERMENLTFNYILARDQ
jgi:hypothetical protein